MATHWRAQHMARERYRLPLHAWGFIAALALFAALYLGLTMAAVTMPALSLAVPS